MLLLIQVRLLRLRRAECIGGVEVGRRRWAVWLRGTATERGKWHRYRRLYKIR